VFCGDWLGYDGKHLAEGYSGLKVSLLRHLHLYFSNVNGESGQMGLNVVRNGSLSFLWVNEKSGPLLELFGFSFSMNAILKVVRDVRESGEAQDETIHETSTGERDKVFNGNGNISNKLVTVVEALLQICQSLFTCKSVE